jgi:hypothetical protein
MASDTTSKRPADRPPGVTVVDGPELHEDVCAMVRAANFAAVSTLLRDGQPQTQVTWVDVDDTHLLINTLPLTQKYRNSQRDRRITVLVWDRQDPEHYVESAGTLSMPWSDRRQLNTPTSWPGATWGLRIVVRRSAWCCGFGHVDRWSVVLPGANRIRRLRHTKRYVSDGQA